MEKILSWARQKNKNKCWNRLTNRTQSRINNWKWRENGYMNKRMLEQFGVPSTLFSIKGVPSTLFSIKGVLSTLFSIKDRKQLDLRKNTIT